MKNVFSKLTHAPKGLAIAASAAIVAAVVPAGILFAWGPQRPTFTTNNPATYVTFNSITDNPVIGDEREFVAVKDAADANTQGGWKDTATVQPGREYLVRVYVHNNAASSLNLKALNTRVSASVPTTTGKNVTVSGFVSADNAQPKQVFDDISFNGTTDFNLAYVPGSAQIFNNGYAKGSGQKLPDSIVTSTGALVGYDKADGVVPGCFQYASYVYFKVKPQFAATPNFEVAKTVSKAGAKQYVESISANAGETVDFRIRYQNTGSTQQDNVVVKDQLPAGMTYVSGSTKLYNSQNLDGKALSDNVTTTGVNIGSHAAGGTSYVIFSAKVANVDTLKCGVNTLQNVARIETPNGSKQDTATVTVTKKCAVTPVEKPSPAQPAKPEAPAAQLQPSAAETPAALPSTGPVAVVGGLLGSSALGLGVHSYLNSRRVLRNALKR